MKLFTENYPEFIRLSNYFRNIETLADKLGLDVDEFLNHSGERNVDLHSAVRKSISSASLVGVNKFISHRERNSDDYPGALTIVLNNRL